MKEAIYTLSILSILIKVLFTLAGFEFPVNLTLVFIPILLATMGYQFSKDGFVLYHENSFYPLTLLFLFWGWMFVTALFSPSDIFKIEKIFLFLLNIILFIYPMIVKLNYRLFFKQFFLLATAIEPVLLVFIPLLLFGDLEGSRAYYLALGQISGVIVLLILVLVKEKLFKLNLKWSLIILIHLIILLSNPARGAIVFTLFLFLIWAFISIYKLLDIKFLFIVLMLSIVGGVIFFHLIQSFPEYVNFILLRMYSLIKPLFSENSSLIEISTYERLEFWKYSYKMIFENNLLHFFFGYGIGSFGVLFSGYDGRLYPHNMFLETWFELGLIGLLILFLFLLSVVFVIIKKKNYYFFFPILITFLGAMKSGSLPDLRLFFSMIAIAMTYQIAKSTNFVEHYD